MKKYKATSNFERDKSFSISSADGTTEEYSYSKRHITDDYQKTSILAVIKDKKRLDPPNN